MLSTVRSPPASSAGGSCRQANIFEVLWWWQPQCLNCEIGKGKSWRRSTSIRNCRVDTLTSSGRKEFIHIKIKKKKLLYTSSVLEVHFDRVLQKKTLSECEVWASEASETSRRIWDAKKQWGGKKLVQLLPDCVSLLMHRFYIVYSEHDVPNWNSCVSIASCCTGLQFVGWLCLSLRSWY